MRCAGSIAPGRVREKLAMQASGPVDTLMLRWEAARRLGQELTAEDLCAACPHLADEVRRRYVEFDDVPGLGHLPAHGAVERVQ